MILSYTTKPFKLTAVEIEVGASTRDPKLLKTGLGEHLGLSVLKLHSVQGVSGLGFRVYGVL